MKMREKEGREGGKKGESALFIIILYRDKNIFFGA